MVNKKANAKGKTKKAYVHKHPGNPNEAPLHKFFVYVEGQATPIGMEVTGWTQKHAEKRLLKMLEGTARLVPCRAENWPSIQNIGHGGRMAQSHKETVRLQEAA
jgi:hypothetical protein